MTTLALSVKPNSRNPGIDKSNPDHWIIRIKEAPSEGMANRALLDILSREFMVPKSSIKIIIGKKSKNKVVSIEEKVSGKK